jgi:hypothetical protein
VPDYYTYKVEVPLLPGQTLAYTPGLGYYAKGTPTPNQATKNTTGLREPATMGTATAYPAPSPATAARTDRQTSGYNEAPLSAVVATAQAQPALQQPTPAERLPPPTDTGEPPPPPTGPLVGLPDGSVYTLGNDGLWHHIPNVDTFNALSLDWNTISWDSELPGSTGDELPTRQPIAAAPTAPPLNGAIHEIQPTSTGTPIPSSSHVTGVPSADTRRRTQGIPPEPSPSHPKPLPNSPPWFEEMLTMVNEDSKAASEIFGETAIVLAVAALVGIGGPEVAATAGTAAAVLAEAATFVAVVNIVTSASITATSPSPSNAGNVAWNALVTTLDIRIGRIIRPAAVPEVLKTLIDALRLEVVSRAEAPQPGYPPLATVLPFIKVPDYIARQGPAAVLAWVRSQL